MNLFIIRTPFQAFLAEKIINKETMKDVVVVYIYPAKNDFQKYAYERIKNLSIKSYYIYLGENRSKIKNLFRHIQTFVYLRALKSHSTFDNIYVGSIDSIPVQLAISYINYDNLYTFDDGSANYNYESVYYNDVEPGVILRTIANCFGRKYSKKELLQKSKGHFAILPNERNINSKKFHINIGLNINEKTAEYKYESCNVLIGISYERKRKH